MSRRILLGVLFWLAPAAPTRALAQAATAPPPVAEAPAPAPTPPAPAPAPAAVAPAASDYECVPACRSGFVCVQATCVSHCNPPCASGQICTDQAQCISACDPPCAQGQTCNDQAQCILHAPPPSAPSVAAPPPADSDWRASLVPGQVRRDDEDGGEVADPRATGKRFHDGFYLRMGVGIGALVGRANAPESRSESGSSSGYDEVGTWGVSIPVEFALGGTPAPGIVIGVGAYGIHVPSAHYSAGRGDFAVEDDAEYSAASMLGPFLDLYVNPEAGFHLQIAPAFTTITPGQSDRIVTEAISGIGFGVMGGLGYEGWIGEQWGMGILLRGQFMTLELETESGATYDYMALLPSLLLTATLH